MKVYGVKNDHISQGFRPSVSLHYDKASGAFTATVNIMAKKCDENGIPMPEIESSAYQASASVNINKLRQRQDWCAHQTYFLAIKDFEFLPVFPLYAETLPLRETAHDYAVRMGLNLLIGINVPFSDSDDDIFVTVNLNADATDDNFIVSGDLIREWSQVSSSGIERVLKFPTIVASGAPSVSAGAQTEVTVRIEDSAGNLLIRDTEVFVEPIYGAISGSRMQIRNGIGKLQISAQGLEAGDTVRAKLGWKYFPGATDVEIKVI